MQVIVFAQDNGIAGVIWPTEEGLTQLGIGAIAARDVPTGRPYKIIDASALPADRSQRMAWTVAEADLTDGVGA
ncbi:hypothetical protein [Rhizobium lentis]|uniref:hypothetical protein n=1 Tax=Rhizobium lentis TaxID=1138194 RepID=UPI001C840845|nr:hypothetical protein [Rhizobium lentis]MBX5148063.1 hypothetical protein [Rhizobium lentis]